jgi:hypothetical protein
MLLGPWLDGIDRASTGAGIQIVHLKAIVQAPTGYIKAALCANGQEPTVEGALDASPATRHEITLNIRALADPESLSAIVSRELQKLDGDLAECVIRCFRPAAPQPERRVPLEDITNRI